MSDNPLKFLNPEDWQLIRANLTHLSFGPGDEIVREGSRDQIIYVLSKGTVRVEVLSSGSRFEVARLGPGEIFGEIAFLEETGASASVTAEDRVEVDSFSGVHLYSLFSSFPGLATRFYQSLAFALSQRLRQRTSQVIAFLQDKLPADKSIVAPRQWEEEET